MDELRSPKRPRLSSEPGDYIPLLVEDDEDAGFQQHAELWFDDGNVTIIAGDIGFKVYRELLRRCSAPISEALLHGDVDGDLPNSLHVLRLDEDKANVELILKWVFHALWPGHFKPGSIAECARYLYVGAKYEIEEYQKQASAFLDDIYVHGLEQFGSLLYKPSSPVGHVVVAFLARRYGLGRLLPAALLWCCSVKYTKLPNVIDEARKIIDDTGKPWADEEIWLLRTCMRATPDTQTSAVLIDVSTFTHPEGCTSNATCSEILEALGNEVKSASLNPLVSFEKLGDFDRRRRAPCVPCREAWTSDYEQQRKKIWEALPARFDLPPWSELARGK